MKGYGAYKTTSVETADQKGLILICYDEAIRSLQMGKDGFLKKAFEEKARQFIRAQDFISELLSSLDLEAGGKIARNLSDIYNFCLRHIMRGDINRDMKAIDDVIAMLSELRSAWEQISEKPNHVDIPKSHLQSCIRMAV